MSQISVGEGFYLTLPSNTSAHVFKNNTGSSFHIDLAQHIDLEGPWQVALMEISYPHTWHNIPQDAAYFEWRKKPATPDGETVVNRRRFRGGYYANFEQLRAELKTHLRVIDSDIFVAFNNIQKRFEFQAGGQYHLRVFPPASYILGMKSGEWFTFDASLAPHPADIKAGNCHLYCYSDVVSHQLVSDAYAPLLRTVPIQGTYGDVITQCFNPASYLPVIKKHIERIHKMTVSPAVRLGPRRSC
ncbi:hypothetical protein ABVT39_009143 [Epinephelus coioides]